MLSAWWWILIGTAAYIFNVVCSRFFRNLLIKEEEHPYNNFLDPAQQLTGLVYGVLLAFVVVLNWQSYVNLSSTLEGESEALLDLWRNSEVFANQPQQQEFHTAILDYLTAIQKEEWPEMELGHPPDVTPTYSKLWNTVQNLQIETPIQNAFYQNLLIGLDKVNTLRRERIFSVINPTPLLFWVFLIGGAFHIVLLTGFYNVCVQLRILLSSLQATMFIFAFYMIANFTHPFSGPLALDAKNYKDVQHTIEELQRRNLALQTASQPEAQVF
ncbi:MAG TPA: hypothetical protein VJK48_01060 [Chlamydiales bacterium]|nr:hypothetical protein [Chlamydiales bacterium]